MLRKRALLICIGAVVLCAAGIALAAAVKVTLEPFPAGSPIEPGASGQAVLNYAKGADKTEVQVNCKGLKPDSDYVVYLKTGGTFDLIGKFITNSKGNGHLHASLAGDRSADLPVAVNNRAGATVLLSP